MSDPKESRIGEVVEASTREFMAQCYDLFEPPPLGSLVKTGERGSETFGLVYEATTSSVDPGRTPVALGRDTASEEDIYRTHPQLPQLLRTDFKSIVVGHRAATLRHGQGEREEQRSTSTLTLPLQGGEKGLSTSAEGRLAHYLPSTPARVHSFVYMCSDIELREFTTSLEFIAPLLEADISNKEEALAACLRRASAVQEDGRVFLIQAGKLLAGLLAGDSARLNIMLKRIRP